MHRARRSTQVTHPLVGIWLEKGNKLTFITNFSQWNDKDETRKIEREYKRERIKKRETNRNPLNAKARKEKSEIPSTRSKNIAKNTNLSNEIKTRETKVIATFMAPMPNVADWASLSLNPADLKMEVE